MATAEALDVIFYCFRLAEAGARMAGRRMPPDTRGWVSAIVLGVTRGFRNVRPEPWLTEKVAIWVEVDHIQQGWADFVCENQTNLFGSQNLLAVSLVYDGFSYALSFWEQWTRNFIDHNCTWLYPGWPVWKWMASRAGLSWRIWRHSSRSKYPPEWISPASRVKFPGDTCNSLKNMTRVLQVREGRRHLHS